MNKPAPTAMRNQAQGGFTLIESIVVIVILGILAATALPRFSSLGNDARVAALQAARGAMMSTAAQAHGQWLINPNNPTVTYEGQTITFSTTFASGYPRADAGFVAASGITAADYTILLPGSAASTTSPGAAANSVTIVPNSVAGTTRAVTCFVNYAEPAAANAQPVITFTADTAGC